MTRHQQQPYDSTLKALFREQITDILSHILPGARLVGELNTDILKPQPPLRADKAYTIDYLSEPHVLHFELETRGSGKMPYRMLSYHALLLEEHDMPVISIIIYPFKTTVAKSPLEETSGGKKLLDFHFRTLPLWTLEAEEYLQSHAIAMYPLLPTMHGANASILLQAIDEMVDNYEGEQLTNRLLWFQTLLGRVETVSVEDKDVVERRLNMFEELLEEDPHIQERVERVAQRRVEAELAAIQAAAEAERARVEAELAAMQAAAEAEHARVETERARVEAEVRTLRQVILSIVQGRFPDLAEAAQPKLEQITEPKLLHNLAFQLSAAPNQTMAQWVLETTRA